MSSNLATEARIIGAIAAKDIGDAIGNRTTLAIIIGTLMILLSSMALPMLVSLDQVPAAIVYDPDRSTLIRALTTREEFRLRIVSSPEELAEAVGSASQLYLGLTIPEGFAQASGNADAVEVVGVIPHWASREQGLELATFFEEQLTEASWREVRISISDTPIYPTPETFGQHSMAANSIAIATLTLGLVLVPGLLIEEKEHGTLAALLVSPARYREIILGKAITGILYSGLAASLAVALNTKWFVHGWLALLGIVLGILFTVAVGLLLGLVVDNPNSANLWMGLVLLGLLLPAFLGALMGGESPGLVQTAIRWIPTSAVGNLLILSMGQAVTGTQWLADVARLAISTLVLIALVLWRVRRLDA